MRPNTHCSSFLLAAMLLCPAALATGQAPDGGKPAATPTTPTKTTPPAPIYDESADATKDIANAVARADRNGTRVLIQWGANWCGWCHLLHRACTKNGLVAKELQGEYEVVLVDVGQFDKQADLAAKYGAEFKSKGVPYLTVLDASGAVIANQETESLELPKGSVREGHDPAKLAEFFKQHKAPMRNADEVLSAGLATAKSEGKLAFVHFGTPWCGWCTTLDNWMAQPQIWAILSKAFVDVKIDTMRMTGGEALMKAHCPLDNPGIPWFEFIDGDGKSLVNSIGPNGNTGYPMAPEENNWFGEMLRKSGAKLSPEEISTLLVSLKTKPTKG